MTTTIHQLTKGKYVFFGTPEQQQGENLLVPYFTASGLSITEEDGALSAKVQLFDISNLISKRSVYVDSQRSLEAHKLYTWPAKLGDPNAWAESKRIFFEDHLIDHPIEILFELGEAQVSWKHISPEAFSEASAMASTSPEFKAVETSLVLKRKVTEG
ncbi:hypothetical protein DBR43_28335 [Pedobacter sp. KBW06]|uniref:hypothetical protein n=1 Tax=Pedobacter sp. KBW06 TaxID=2153359 RepID=UPI000F5A987C|nr:hypothetical protein [Pedobacter sp. KBW06]RQO66144.1 hypothetical protein DBR43_28335 [Pedobacter sp. KBW06]